MYLFLSLRSTQSSRTLHEYSVDERWRLGLLTDSERAKYQLYADDLVVILKDKYPKARYHYLVLPKAPIDTVEDLSHDHVPLLRHMIEQGEVFCEKEVVPKTKNPILMGFHIFPTFIRLHLHLISSDFDSFYMKSVGVYSSFTTSFFLTPQRAIEILESGRKISSQEIIGSESSNWAKNLKCHICSASCLTWAKLKEHIAKHDKDT